MGNNPKKDLGMVVEDIAETTNEIIDSVIELFIGESIHSIAEIYEIFEDESIKSEWTGDNAYQGLNIIAKYFDTTKVEIITFASHDDLWSVSLDDAIHASITREDVIKLRKLNWSVDRENDCFHCYI